MTSNLYHPARVSHLPPHLRPTTRTADSPDMFISARYAPAESSNSPFKPLREDWPLASAHRTSRFLPEKSISPLPTSIETKLPIWEKILYVLDWMTKVIALTACIIFCIWAPFQYKATADGLLEISQAQISQALQASDIATAQRQQQTAIAALENQLAAIGQLQLLGYCGDDAKNPACSSYLASAATASLFSYLASPTPATTSNLPSDTTIDSPDDSGGESPITIPIMLGIVAGATVLIGAGLGLIIWPLMRRAERKKEQDEAPLVHHNVSKSI